jgi:hypothetical protein
LLLAKLVDDRIVNVITLGEALALVGSIDVMAGGWMSWDDVMGWIYA